MEQLNISKNDVLSLLKENYLSPEEKLILKDKLNLYTSIWLDIVLKHSSDKYSKLSLEQSNAFDIVITDFNLNFNQSKSINQIDSILVKYILQLAVKVNNKVIIDLIYKRTKNAIPDYFYSLELINAYLKLEDIDTAIEILNIVYNKNHVSCFYKILNINKEKYKNIPIFFKYLKNIKYKCYAQLLNNGEKINLNNIVKEDLIEIMKYIK